MELLYRACRHGCMKQAWFSQLPPQVLRGAVPAQLICASAGIEVETMMRAAFAAAWP